MFDNKILLVTGGTGSFGNAVLKALLNTEVKEIRIFSRDEKKQDDMRKKYMTPKLKFFLGDVREYDSVAAAMYDVNYVFHAAALKQVPACEFYPMQALKTNVLGTENVIEAAIQNDVEKVVCLSTDKAVYPVNAMGISKALMEKVVVAKTRELINKKTIVCGTRFGNVMASRGSVIPLFIQQICEDNTLTITDPTMTRFMMSIEDAIKLVLFAFANGKNGDIFVQKSPAVCIELLASVIAKLFGKKWKGEIKTIGTRHGEKLYETLLTREEMLHAEDMKNYYRISADARDLNYGLYYEEGKSRMTSLSEYNSHSTVQLSEEELTKILLELPAIQNDLKKVGAI